MAKKKTRLFVATLLEQLREKDKNEIKKCQLSLLSEKNELRLAEDLYYFMEEDATCYLDSCYLKRIPGISHDETFKLAELCGVNILPFNQEIEREKEIYDNTLKEFYLERLSFIVIQESKKLNEDVHATLRRLYDMICAIKLYQCHKMFVKYPFGDPTKIRHHFEDLTFYVVGKWVNKKSTICDYLSNKLCLETDIRDIIDMEHPITQNDKQEWLSDEKDPEIFYFVEEELNKLLSSEGKEELDILPPAVSVVIQPHHSEYEEKHFKDSKLLVNKEELTASESSSDESSADRVADEPCLKMQYAIKEDFSGVYDTFIDELEVITRYETTTDPVVGEDIIEVETRCLVQSELGIECKNRMLQIEIPCSYSSMESLHTGSSRFSQGSRDKSHIKWLSEKYVFTYLQDHYKSKYPNSQSNLSEGIFTLCWRSHKMEIVWLNESGEKGQSYDLLLRKQGEVKRLIEVESTNDVVNNDSFNISHRNFIRKINHLASELPDHKEKYCIYRVFNTDNSSSVEEFNSSAALYKVVSLKNPYIFQGGS